MTRQLKEKTIPITLSQFAFLCLLSITLLSLYGFISHYQYWNPNGIEDEGESIFAFSLAGLLLGGIFTLILASINWDINPVHAIGYCLRWKDDY